jgi:hypothetical protein
MRYRKHAEKSEDTDETVDGPDSWNPPKLPAPIRKELPIVEDLQEVVTKLRSEMDHLRHERQDE